MRAKLERDFDRFKRELPRDFPAHVRETYAIDLTARYLGAVVPHPIGKGSGQLSLNTGQLEDDATRSEEHTSELQSRLHLVCRLLLEKKNLMYSLLRTSSMLQRVSLRL